MGVHSATLAGYVMPESPFDWEREGSDPWRGKHRGSGDGSFVNHYEFNEVITHIEEKIYALHLRQDSMDDRLIDTRAKRVALDVFTSIWTKFAVIVFAVLTAFVLTNVIHVSNPFS